MTYCLAIAVADGLVFASDSRTNAGADQISTHSKLHRFGGNGERALVLLSAGNLATTQGVVATLERDIKRHAAHSLMTVEDLQAAAEYVGKVSTEEQQKHSVTRRDDEFVPEATFILGGQIRGESPCIELIYPEGNFVGSSQSTPFLQIGEVKYGKPILDRIIASDTSLEGALTCALVSMDSTMRSNATVGPPLEFVVYRADSFATGIHAVLDEDDDYLLQLRRGWANNIRAAFDELPAPPAIGELTVRGKVARIT